MIKNDLPADTMPKRNVWLKILVPLLSFLVSILIAELVLRFLVHPPADWTQKNQVRLEAEGTRRYPPSEPLFASFCKDRPKLKHEARRVLGFRLREYNYPQIKPAGTYRIIGLGDSFAWGWGIIDNRRTFFKLLECWLNKQNPSHPVELINASKPGVGVNYYQRFMDKTGWQLNPDQVVISFNINDANIKYVSLSIDAKTARRLEERSGFWTKNSRLIQFVRNRLLRKHVRQKFIKNVHDAILGEKRSECWDRANATLLAIAQGCQQRGIDLLVVVFPLLVDLERSYPFTAEVDEIVRFCHQNRIDCINLLPTFLGKKSELLWSLPSDTHPNQVAHRLAAETIFRTLSHPDFITPHK